MLKLKPVTFRYKEELDPDKVPQFGLVAEEVEKVDPELVVRDDEGNVTTVRYEAVNAMLLNEFLKEHRRSSS
jgi:Chaperone of endosialidase